MPSSFVSFLTSVSLPGSRAGSWSGASDPWVPAVVAILGTLVLTMFLGDALMVTHKIPFDPREGWNAYNATAAVSGGGALYPARTDLWFNNYPPLSFFLVGGLGELLGDPIVAGRVVSLISAAGTALAVGTVARLMGCNKSEAGLSALMVLASPWLLAKYAAIDDPQMLGHVIGCTGFAVLVRRPGNTRSVAVGALLLTLAVFVKPLFISQPLALFVWLAWYERRMAVHFAAWCILFGFIGLAAVNRGLGTNLIDHILSARVYLVSRMMSHPGQWLVTGLIPMSASLYLFRYARDRYAILCAIYAGIAFILALFFNGGEGVGGNSMIEASIATALGAAVFINRIKAGAPLPGLLGAHPARAVALACLAPQTVVLVVAAFGGWSSGPSIPERLHRQPTAKWNIGYLQMHDGAALCETSALCYWAGKAKQVDVWGLSQALRKRACSEDSLIQLLDGRYFRVIQLGGSSTFAYCPDLHAALVHNYRTDRVDDFGVFLVPR